MPEPTRTSFHCIDAHTCGNPVRLVYRGGPELHLRILAAAVLAAVAERNGNGRRRAVGEGGRNRE